MTYKSSSISVKGGLNLMVHHWPAIMPKSILLIIHGYAEHGYRYDEFARLLNEHQIEVYSYDQRGHGASEGIRAYVERFDLLLDDLDKMIAFMNSQHRKIPLFLMGHSMGGLVVTKYCIERNVDGVKGLITSAAALKLDENLSPVLQFIAPLLGKIFPKLKTQKLDKTYLTRSEDNLKSYMNDPLNYLEGTRARTGAELIGSIKETATKFNKLALPLLALHGTGEKLTDYRGTERLYNESVSTDKELKLYNGLYHELIHEPEKEIVMDDIICWIESRS